MIKSTLIAQNIHKHFPGVHAVNDVSATFQTGQVVAVIGENGAGKSTLSNAVMGKPGYHITSGLIELDGREISALPTWERAQAGLFLAMQYPTEVPGVSVRETL